jgi:tungstate transport system substrate-binding protein
VKFKNLLILLVLLLAACGGSAAPAAEPDSTGGSSEESAQSGRLILATTTSTYDSGLLDAILPDFEEQSGLSVEVVAVGTGQALALGEQGDADVLLVHARAREDAFMDEGHGVRREDVMYNDFVILGSADDPAGIAGMSSAEEAFAAIAGAEELFISRGDDSGTHTKEKEIWEAAGIEPAGDWYRSIGQGMGATLTMANEEQAYTLSDRGTYLSRALEDDFMMDILVEGDPILFNPYGVMAVNPDKSDQINLEGANEFIDWLVSLPVQEVIAEYGIDKFGSPLFTPDSEAWRAAQ